MSLRHPRRQLRLNPLTTFRTLPAVEAILCYSYLNLRQFHHLMTPFSLLFGWTFQRYTAVITAGRTKLHYLINLIWGELEAVMAQMPWLCSSLAPSWGT
jgi:hypothetical protein